MRPTNRMLIRPSARICSSAGRRGALGDPLGVDRDRQHAGRREPQRLELRAVELRIAERQIDMADQRSQLLPAERRQPEEAGIVGREERRRRDVVILQDARAVQRRERLGHRRRQREMEDRDVAPACGRIGERPDVAAQVVVDRQRVQVRLVPSGTQHVAHAPGAVADRIPLVRRRYPLVDDHRPDGRSTGSARYSARPVLAQLLEPLELLELLPEVPGDLRGPGAAAARGRRRRTAAACRRSRLRRSRSSAASCDATTDASRSRIVEDRRP